MYFLKIFKYWNPFNIWDLANIYNSLNSLTKIWKSFNPLNTGTDENSVQYFVLDFRNNRGLFERYFHNQKFLRVWISDFRVKWP